MPVTDYFLLWKVTVPSSWIAVVLGFLTAWVAVRGKFGKEAADAAGDALLTILIVWKLSVVVTDFSVVLRSPAAILYFNGGAPGFLAGMALAGLLALLSKKKLPVNRSRVYLLTAACAQAGYQIVMVLLNDGTAGVKLVTAVLFGAGMAAAIHYTGRQELPVRSGMLLLIAVHGFAAALQPAGLASIPVAVTAAAGVIVILSDVRSAGPKEQMEGLDE